MLVTKLAAYARANDLVDDPLFEKKAVNFVLTIDAEGNLLTAAPLGDSKRGLESLVPKKVGGNKGGVATFGTDNARFVLGLVDDSTDEVKADRDLAAFRALIDAAALGSPQSPGFRSAAKLYAEPERFTDAQEQARAAGVKESSRVAIAFVGDNGVHLANTSAGRAFWEQYRTAQEADKPRGDAVLCLSCGNLRPPVATNNTKIMGLLGGQPSGTALVSFDKEAFRSHGWEQNANAAVCEDCSQAYALGLNHLLRRDNPQRTRIDEAGVTFVVWAEGEGQDFALVEAIEDPGTDDEWLKRLEAGPANRSREEANPDAAGAILLSPITGVPLTSEADPRVYVLGLRGNGGRAVVVDWFDVKGAEASANVKRWFEDLQVQLIFDQYHTKTDRATKVKERTLIAAAGDRSRPYPRWALCRATVRDEKEEAPSVPAAILRAAIKGDPLPLSIADAAERHRR